MAVDTDGKQLKSESYGEEVVESSSDRMMLELAVARACRTLFLNNEGAPEKRRRYRSTQGG